MTYVFDTSALSVLFKNYYRGRFRTLWANFDAIVDEGRIISTREVAREIKDSSLEDLREWTKVHEALFTTPTAPEGSFVAEIFSVRHFQQNIEEKKLYKGGKNADPFVIAKAAVVGASVVTMESLRPNAARIPNICDHFEIPCLTLEGFMEAEEWQF